MCHPGRPFPHGLSQVGSPGLAAFHSAKSAALRLPEESWKRGGRAFCYIDSHDDSCGQRPVAVTGVVYNDTPCPYQPQKGTKAAPKHKSTITGWPQHESTGPTSEHGMRPSPPPRAGTPPPCCPPPSSPTASRTPSATSRQSTRPRPPRTRGRVP